MKTRSILLAGLAALTLPHAALAEEEYDILNHESKFHPVAKVGIAADAPLRAGASIRGMINVVYNGKIVDREAGHRTRWFMVDAAISPMDESGRALPYADVKIYPVSFTSESKSVYGGTTVLPIQLSKDLELGKHGQVTVRAVRFGGEGAFGSGESEDDVQFLLDLAIELAGYTQLKYIDHEGQERVDRSFDLLGMDGGMELKFPIARNLSGKLDLFRGEFGIRPMGSAQAQGQFKSGVEIKYTQGTFKATAGAFFGCHALTATWQPADKDKREEDDRSYCSVSFGVGGEFDIVPVK